ncbi:MAG: GDP-mannose 4,6-dehydratase, partial [Chitinivibrionales bacterium]|nr:GDP-mannose 4,6-dehydratase [Chitinivibrionales bacterium]
MKTLVTGCAGFIGFHVARHLLERGDEVVGLDNFNSYYSVTLKEDRMKLLQGYDTFSLVRMDLMDRNGVAALFQKHQFRAVCHLAAQAGVRYSLTHPH